jgi:hypothetical protein
MTDHEHDTERDVTESVGDATEDARRDAGEEHPAAPAGLGQDPGEDDPDTDDALSVRDEDGGEVRPY